MLKVFVKNPTEYGDAAEYEMYLPRETAVAAFDDGDDFIKRNRIRIDSGTIYLDRLKDPADRAVLERITERVYTGWVDLSRTKDDVAAALISSSGPEHRQTEWETITLEETNEICSRCPISWDKGRGCIGSFGPDNSMLPVIASKYGCGITASVPDGAVNGRMYTKDDATVLLKEIPILRGALEKEGKLAVKRYAGTTDRLEAVASISVREGCGFFFF